MTAPDSPGETGSGDAIEFIQAARRQDFEEAEAIWQRSANPALLAGQCIGILLDLARTIAAQLGAADGPAYADRILDEVATGGAEPVPVAPPDPDSPEPAAPEPRVVDANSPEITAAAGAAVLAAFDGDDAGLNAVLGTLSYEEAVGVAAAFAHGFAAAAQGENRDAVRASIIELLQRRPEP